MTEKITSIRIDEGLWRKAKILAIERGIVLKDLVEELLTNEVMGNELVKNPRFSEELFQRLEQAVSAGEMPFVISNKKTAIELVREGRGR